MTAETGQGQLRAPTGRPAVVRVQDIRQLAVFEPGKAKAFTRRLPYRNWALTVSQTRNTLRISIRGKYGGRTYTRLSITLKDLKYLLELLNDIRKELEKAGFELRLI